MGNLMIWFSWQWKGILLGTQAEVFLLQIPLTWNIYDDGRMGRSYYYCTAANCQVPLQNDSFNFVVLFYDMQI